MTSFIGLPGALVPLGCMATEDRTDDRLISEAVSFSGRRHVQVGSRVRRSWSIGYDAGQPGDFAVLDALTRWETPLSWVGDLAQATNLLTPEQALLDHAGSALVRGALDLGDGVWVAQWATGHASSTVSVTGAYPVPVRAEVPVTASAYVQRADPAKPVQAVLQFLDATGAVLSALTLDGPAGSGIQRVSWTRTPPAGAAGATVVIRYAAVLAAPQITWTPVAVPYAPGRGVYRVIVLPESEKLLATLPKKTFTRADYTIMEVG